MFGGIEEVRKTAASLPPRGRLDISEMGGNGVPKQKRPLSVTIVAAYLMVSAFFAIVGLVVIAENPEIRRAMAQLVGSVTMLVSTISIVVDGVSAVAILRRREWGRQLWGWWTGAAILFDYLVLPTHWTRFVSFIMYGVVVFVLFRKPASKWFEDVPDDAELSKIFG